MIMPSRAIGNKIGSPGPNRKVTHVITIMFEY